MAQEPKKKPSLEAFQEEIRKRAGEIFKERVGKNKPGDELSDWLQAEKEIKKRNGIEQDNIEQRLESQKRYSRN